jgi:ribose transport system substrate-binding protein
LAFFICLISFMSMNAGGTESTRSFRVGVLYWSMNIPGQIAMRKGLEAEAKRINDAARKSGAPGIVLIPETAGDGPEGIERQIRQMRTMIASRPDILVVQPTDNAALAAPLKEANAAGIPVVAFDQYISSGQLAAYVTSDNRQAGYLDGEYIASRFGGSTPLRLIIVEYPLVSSTVERLNGFLDALSDHGKRYKILKTYQAVEPVAGRKAGEAILRDFPARNSIDVVFSVNDGGGLAVVDALAKAGRDEIAVASIDGDPASVENIRQGRLTLIDSAQFCGPLGAEALRVAHAILRKQPVARQILVPVFPVTRETLDRYPGWLGPIPASFEKPWKANQPKWLGNAVEAN